jgi:uncharacterized protein
MSDRPAFVETAEALREIYELPSKGAVAKEISRIDPHCRRFIEMSPFVCLGTTSADGRADVSPRGGEPGFVHVFDNGQLAIPDRPGNNRLDSLTNMLANPAVGLLFFVPGFEDLLRVNGHARITIEPALLDRFTIDGRAPRSVILVEVNEAQLHCVKAVKRAGLWNQAALVDRRSFSTAGQILKDHLATEVSAAAIDAMAEKDARERLY